DSPIIATTAVQFLNTLFAASTSCIRRMQALGDSVIILDEIQALPIKVFKLFNTAMNYLAYFCQSSVILCSATQPLLDKLDRYCILPPVKMLEDESKYDDAFRRVQIKDYTNEGGMSYAEAADFISEQAEKARSVLAIVNTKKCAQEVFKHLKSKVDPSCLLFHLSTNMCAAHRKTVLDKIRAELSDRNNKGKIICVSTTLIEAGVDVSFERVVRSLTGLDSIVQAAGRCNRNRETDCGIVSIINIREESISSLENISKAQEATRDLLYSIKANSDNYPGGILAKSAMDEYYARYFRPLQKQMEYPLKDNPERTIIDLLTDDPARRKRFEAQGGNSKTVLLKQAFREAGHEFFVIDDSSKNDVIIDYDDEANKLLSELKTAKTIHEKKAALLSLQRYTVQLRINDLKKLDAALQPFETGLYILDRIFYDKNLGVNDTGELPVELFII
ncbi:MAG: helicase-related protein, partial [Clostridiaceae bacterium]